MTPSPSRAALRIAGIYTAISATWIVVSDRAVAAAVQDATLLTTIQTAKGWAFVAASALLLHLLVEREMRRRGRSEVRLVESERLYRTLVEQPLAGVYVLDDEGLLYVNPRLAEIFGFDPGELARRASLDLLVAPDDRTALRERIQDLLAGEVEDRDAFAFRGIRRTGEVIHLEAHGARIEQLGRPAVVGMLQDVTERRLVDERRQQAQKMEAVGRLAGGIAHDFNNLLTAITGCTDLVRGAVASGEDPAEDLDEIEKTARRGAALTRQLLAFSRREEGEPRPVSLNAVVAGMEGILQRLVRRNLEVRMELDATVGAVLVDPDQLEQVILNLVVNAQDAVAATGTVTVRTRAPASAGEGGGEGSGTMPMLEVEDTGDGIHPDVLSRIFEPFFSTKAPGRGTGLGLSTVHTIVTRAGGRVEVKSEPGRGSTFRILLPGTRSVDGAAGPAPQGPRTEAGMRGTILLVEDEPGVRRVGGRILERAGYEVLLAATLGGGLEQLRNFPRPIHLLVVDPSIPGALGTDLVQEARAARPQLAVLLTDAAGTPRGSKVAGVTVLPKPYAPEELTRRVQEILAGRASPDRRSSGL